MSPKDSTHKNNISSALDEVVNAFQLIDLWYYYKEGKFGIDVVYFTPNLMGVFQRRQVTLMIYKIIK